MNSNPRGAFAPRGLLVKWGCVLFFTPDIPVDFFLGQGLTAVNGSITNNWQALCQHLRCLSLFYLY